MIQVSHNTAATQFAFDNTYARDLEGFYVPWQAAQVAQPALVQLNRALAEELGLDAKAFASETGAQIFAGNTLPEGATPLAQAYAGHQFGGFSPQLGDGRALLLGEVLDRSGRRRDIQLKGSGRTPFSRSGDGRAALGPVLREYLIGEAMHALGIPTTRALAAVRTGEPVYREAALPGAVLTRVAASHIRVGTFQWVASHGQPGQVRRLADYVIDRHYPALQGQADPYLRLLESVCDRHASLVARWMHVGFIHGVMNTDNIAISGETIDYGPCAFMDHYDPATVFSSIDTYGRYAYAQQPQIAQWNLARFAETLLPLIDADQQRAIARATEVIHAFPVRYQYHWLQGMRAKLGLFTTEEADADLATGLLTAMEGQHVDYTLAFRYLADAAMGEDDLLHALFTDAAAYERWRERWQARLACETVAPAVRAQAMRRVNPAFIARNHRVEEALSAAVDHDDYTPFETLVQILLQPFDDQPAFAAFMQPAPEGQGVYRTFCGT
ncbi:MAG: YdiU family protein [Candidatus Tectomicrobia bacterium]|uniref:Protein nucleotidyltransferase YdiU n=1 Tax=Tectimicrobiota bacterium TaxID=2528274 RepID=A0A937W3E8_UNCTE|nr:YdiU family protein [Candidatus Tectomicrobia bacterium]